MIGIWLSRPNCFTISIIKLALQFLSRFQANIDGFTTHLIPTELSNYDLKIKILQGFKNKNIT